jgi:intracellular sulfur oxidation DsrE/DsrF family protein
MKVIFHVDEPEKWQLALENVRNFLNAEPEAEIEVLANSAGVKFYIQGASANDLFAELVGEGVRFAACNNALRKFGYRSEDLPEALLLFRLELVELAARQKKDSLISNLTEKFGRFSNRPMRRGLNSQRQPYGSLPSFPDFKVNQKAFEIVIW